MNHTFKVNDRICYTGKGRFSTKEWIGRAGTVEAVEDFYVRVDWDGSHSASWAHHSNVDLYGPAKSEPVTVLTPGARVRYRVDCLTSPELQGLVGSVVRLHDYGHRCVWVKFDSLDAENVVYSPNLDLVLDEPVDNSVSERVAELELKVTELNALVRLQKTTIGRLSDALVEVATVAQKHI